MTIFKLATSSAITLSLLPLAVCVQSGNRVYSKDLKGVRGGVKLLNAEASRRLTVRTREFGNVQVGNRADSLTIFSVE